MVVVLDGPLGSELTRRGVATGGIAWSADANLRAPDVVAHIHRDHVAIGCDLIRANTFRARPERLADWEASLDAAVFLAKDAAPTLPIYGSVAPFGDCYEPATPDLVAARRSHEAVIERLLRAGVDGLAFETFPNAQEACMVHEIARQTGLPFWISLTAGPSGNGTSPAELAETARQIAPGARWVGVNCIAAALIAPFVAAIAETSIPVAAYPNASRWNEPPLGPVPFRAAVAVLPLVAVGACCGASLGHVRELLAAFRPPSTG
jgi:S-methylmethionine-dependent homocysteine/selenocysteine methylase